MTWQISSGPNSDTYSVYTDVIRQGETDHRQLRLIRLQNGMQVLLIHDVNSPTAAVGLRLSVGSLHDPVCLAFLYLHGNSIMCIKLDRPGLAHFCEHVVCEVYYSPFYCPSSMLKTLNILERGASQ
jgi:insulysin